MSDATPRAPARARGALHGMWEPLRFRNYRLLFSGQLISGIGDAFYAVALPWLVLTSGGGPQELGFVLAIYGLPRAITTLLGGWLSDRIRPQRVMLLADSVRMLLVGALALLAITGHLPLAALCALVAAFGAFDGLFIPASLAITPDVLPDEVLGAGNALTFSWTYLATLIGPGIAGLVVSRFGSGNALGVDALSFLISALTLWAMRPRAIHARLAAGHATAADAPEQAAAVTEHSFIRFVLHTRLYQLILLIVIVLNLVLGGVVDVGLPALAFGPLHAGASGYGALLAAFGGGALVGGLSGSLVTRLPRQGIISYAIFCVQGVCIIVASIAGSMLGTALAIVVWGFCNGSGNVTFMTLLQKHLPRELMGRMSGALAFGNFGLFPISVAVAGVLAARFGPAAIIAGSGGLSVVVILLALIPPDIRRL